MCGIILSMWIGRHNNGPIVQGPAVNTRVVKLQPVTVTPQERKEGGTSAGKDQNGNERERNKILKLKEDQKTLFLSTI